MKTKTKQTTRTGPESEKWTSHGGFSAGKGRGRIREEKVQGIRSIIGRHKIDGERTLRMVKNGIGNREFKELICTTHGHELRGRKLEGWGCRAEGG